MSVPALRGSNVTLRPMTYDDVPDLMRWGSDPDFRQYQWGQKPGAFEEKNARLRELLLTAIPALPAERDCPCATALEGARFEP